MTTTRQPNAPDSVVAAWVCPLYRVGLMEPSQFSAEAELISKSGFTLGLISCHSDSNDFRAEVLEFVHSKEGRAQLSRDISSPRRTASVASLRITASEVNGHFLVMMPGHVAAGELEQTVLPQKRHSGDLSALVGAKFTVRGLSLLPDSGGLPITSMGPDGYYGTYYYPRTSASASAGGYLAFCRNTDRFPNAPTSPIPARLIGPACATIQQPTWSKLSAGHLGQYRVGILHIPQQLLRDPLEVCYSHRNILYCDTLCEGSSPDFSLTVSAETEDSIAPVEPLHIPLRWTHEGELIER